MNFVSYVGDLDVGEGSVAVIWIGQAGFIIKTHGGRLIAIDPYLSDLAHHNLQDTYGYGFKRLMPALFDAGQIGFDVILISHEHPDHLDMEALPGFLSHSKTKVYLNRPSMQMARAQGYNDRLYLAEREKQYDFGEFSVTCTVADHGQDTPGALGFLLDFGFVKIYFAGDTCYNKRALAPVCAQQPEICILPINGAFGNLDAGQAFSLACDLKSRVCIPCHYWMLPMHGGSPQDFLDCFDNATDCRPAILCLGEAFLYDSVYK